MHYYTFNIGDYRRDTNHLSLLEHGIYRSLIDTYYMNEGHLCADDAKLMRTHSIRTEDEQQAYKNVITDFFKLKGGIYTHAGCDKTLDKIYEKSQKARESAQKRWAKDANAMRTHSEGNANGMLPINPIPINPSPILSPELEAQDSPVAFKLPTNKFNTQQEEYFVREDFIAEMSLIYPNVDIRAEILKMRGWCLTNTAKRKTISGMPKFINTWLTNKQDEGGRNENSKRTSGNGKQSNLAWLSARIQEDIKNEV